MKILVLIKKWKGGVGSYVRSIKPLLEKKGFYVKVISREDDLKIFSLWKSIFPIRTLVKRLMKKEKFDIIYTQDWSMAFPLLFPFPIFKNKHFCCFHGNERRILSRILQEITGKIIEKKLFVVGPTIKKRFKKAVLNYEASDLSLFKPIHSKREFLGFVEKETEILSSKDIKIICKKINMKSLIAGNIPWKKMNKFYNKLRIFISLPPKEAGFNLVWLEAMASGVPIIVGNNEGVGKELPITKVEDFGWNKAKTKKEKVELLIKTIKNAKPKNYRRWLEKNKKKFSWEEHVRRLVRRWGEVKKNNFFLISNTDIK